jgi:plasmid replication initiation protein
MATKKLAKVQKSNEMNQANFSDFSLSCYRVLLNLISQIQRHDTEGNQLSLPVVNRSCSLSAVGYAQEFKIDSKNAYAILKEATDKLLKTTFTTRSVRGNLLKINVCSQAEYIDHEGRIDIRFTEEIMPHLTELGEKFTMYNLNEIAGFGSIYTTRLYEILMQFKTTGELRISVADLRFKLGCTEVFSRYNDLKRFAIDHAVNEINSQWTLDLKYKEIKTGRTITDLIFKFKQTFTRKAYDPVQKKMRTQLTRPRRKTAKEMAADQEGLGIKPKLKTKKNTE